MFEVRTTFCLQLLLLLSCFSRVRLCVTPQTAAHQALLSLGFSRQEHWSGLPFPSPPNLAAAKSLQSCPTLCDPIDGSPPGSAVPGILQARTLEWVAISFSNAWKWKVKVKSLSRVRLLVTPWTAAHQAPPSMGFSRQEYWSGVPLPSPLSTVKSKQLVTLKWNTLQLITMHLEMKPGWETRPQLLMRLAWYDWTHVWNWWHLQMLLLQPKSFACLPFTAF